MDVSGVKKPRVAITGLSSFTGAAIANRLSINGYNVVGQTLGLKKNYTDLKRNRLVSLEKSIQLNEGINCEDDSIVDWIMEVKPKIWIHHHHYMKDFRSPDYDLEKARQVAVQPCEKIVRTLSLSGCQGIIYSGTMFEPGESGGQDLSKVGKYAISKSEAWLDLVRLSEIYGIRISKVVIPNVFGPRENKDRLIPKLISNAMRHKPMRLKNPSHTADNIPINNLADTYVDAVEFLLEGGHSQYRPSGWIVDVGSFCREVNKSLIEKYLGVAPCEIELTDGAVEENLIRECETKATTLNLEKVWQEYALWLKAGSNLNLYMRGNKDAES